MIASVCALGISVVRALGALSEPPVVPELLPEAETFDDRRQPEAAPWRARPLVLEAQVGLGAPLGIAGVAVDFSPSAGVSANLGAGIGHATGALQVGASLRMRLVIAHGFAAGAEAGLAAGRYDEDIGCCGPSWRWERAVWAFGGLALERRWDDGFALRWSFGSAAILNVPDGECPRCRATEEPGVWATTTLPYTMLAAGYAFSP
jgi:hypothetical protein